MFKTFKARIKPSFPIRSGNQLPIDHTITFSKRRILLKDEQLNRIYLDPMLVRLVVDREEYDFDKLLNKNDEKQFSIILKHKLNLLDNGIEHLEISWWNKIKANIIHKRYWIHKNADWVFKSIVTTVVGALIALIADHRGFNEGYQKGLKEGKLQIQDTTRKQ